MKKLLLVAAACVALASCVKNEFEPTIIDESPIGFQAVQGLESTRAAFGGTSFIASAYLIEADKTNHDDWDAAAKGDKEAYFEDQTVKLMGSEWTTDPAQYWPKQGRLTFFAYTPADVTPLDVDKAGTFDFVATNYDVNAAANKNKDLMVADIAKNLNANTVPAVFRHKLTNVLFTAKKAAGDTRTITLTKITLKGLQHKGTYTQPFNYKFGVVADKWEQTADVSDYELLTDPVVVTEAETPVSIAQSFFLPQKFTNTKVVYIEYTIQNGGSSETVKNTLKLSDLDNLGTNDDEWLMNDQVTYQIEIAGPTKIIWTPSVEGWKPESNVIAI